MIRDFAEGLLFIFSLLVCIALLGVDYDRSESPQRVFGSAEYKTDINVRAPIENKTFIATLERDEP